MKLLGICVSAGLLLTITGCPNQSRNDSVRALNKANKANGSKQFETAISEYQKAVDKWHDNHSAWYGMGIAYAQKGDWDKASEAFSTAVQIADDQGMYQMWYGISLYEKAVSDARKDQARRENKKPEEIEPDLTAVNFEKSMQHLQEAVKRIPDLWRAHYYLGRIARNTDKSKEAAEEFSKALQADPREAAPYVALAELYLHWDYTDQAIKVAQQGTVNVPGSNEVSDIWFDLGRGYDDKRMENEAIDAYTHAVESKKDNHKAVFQRGQAYFRKGDYVHAKRDLEDFSKTGGASLAFDKQEASKMLMDIAAKSAGADASSGQKESPEDLVKKSKGGFHPPKR
jgi:tetratricopeptide (TPR) repeat protein